MIKFIIAAVLATSLTGCKSVMDWLNEKPGDYPDYAALRQKAGRSHITLFDGREGEVTATQTQE